MIDLKSIADNFNLTIVGDTLKQVVKVTSLDDQESDGLTWVKNQTYLPKVEKGVVLINESLYAGQESDAVTYLITKQNPKLVFSLIIKTYFAPDVSYYLKNCVEEHRENPKISIGDNVFIGQDVTIGDHTVIFPNAVIEAGSKIGAHCVIKSHVSIGTEGVGMTDNPETGLLEKFPQIGIAQLDDYVEIGPNSTVRRGALKITRIRKGTKIGSFVNIGHNSDLGENCILTSGIVIAGSANIGANAFIGVNCSVRNGVTIGKNSQIGMGSVITKDIPDNVTAFGIPAKIKLND